MMDKRFFLAAGLAVGAAAAAVWRFRTADGQGGSAQRGGTPPHTAAVVDRPQTRPPSRPAHTLPRHRTPAEQVLAAREQARDRDVRWQEGKTWSLVYHITDDVTDFLKRAHTLFFSENGLSPIAFPSLQKFEAEVVAIAADLLGGDAQTVGNLTSGGTESLLMAVKTARDWGRAEKQILAPEMVLPVTAHPAFEKAAHYFGVKAVRIPVGPDFRADVEAVRAAITPNTVLLVASAPSYPQGVVDPVAALAQIAQERGILCHVDACVGGFMLPFVRKLGYPVPDFDFRLPGVTSISADLHKYAYAAKGASLILYRDRALRRYQFFAYTDWPGGVYASPTLAGTRPAGPIAAAWAILHYLGEEGYLDLTEQVMATVARLRAGVEAIEGVHILGDPAMSILAIGSDRLNIYEVADELTLRGWHLDRQQFPPSLHLTVTPAHARVADPFLADLEAAVARARRLTLPRLTHAAVVASARAAARLLPAAWMSGLTGRASSLTGLRGAAVPQRSAAMYGMMAALPNRGDLNELVMDVLDKMTKVDPTP